MPGSSLVKHKVVSGLLRGVLYSKKAISETYFESLARMAIP